jgi:NCAIR mutase (PurE)-related protein
MDRDRVRTLLEEVRAGAVDVERALARLRLLPYERLAFATLDHHRGLRQGLSEVIYCPGKTRAQVVAIARRLRAAGGGVLATRATPDVARALLRIDRRARYFEAARAVVIQSRRAGAATGKRPGGTGGAEAARAAEAPPTSDSGRVLIITAGTADIPCAEETRVTAEYLGSAVELLVDVGVAGLHRLLDHHARLDAADVIVVVAGMDGALPSVVGGLTDRPLIAVPTSTGYGAGMHGFAALLTMLNACAPGVAVVNIDNGFGAGVLAHRIASRTAASPRTPRISGRKR